MTAAALGNLQGLIDWTLKGSLLLLAALIALLAFKRLAPSFRHLILLCAVVGALLVPVFSGILPGWDLAFIPEIRLPSQNAASDSEAVPFSGKGMIEPLHAIYSRNCINTIRAGIPASGIERISCGKQ